LEPPSCILDFCSSREIFIIFALIVYVFVTGCRVSLGYLRDLSIVNTLELEVNPGRKSRRVRRFLSNGEEYFAMLSFYALLSRVVLIVSIINIPIPLLYSIPLLLLSFYIVNILVSRLLKNREIEFAKSASFLINFMAILIKPFIYVYLKYLMVLSRNREDKEALSIEKITKPAHDDEYSDEEEKRLLKGIAKLSDTPVSLIMKPRVEVTALDITMSSEEVFGRITESGYSRLPVYEGNLDNIKGFIYIKDLIAAMNEGFRNFHWQKYIRKAYFVPGCKKIDDLLEEFRQKKIHLAMVVDEYGGTDGIVTLEDVLEEILGEISDETD